MDEEIFRKRMSKIYSQKKKLEQEFIKSKTSLKKGNSIQYYFFDELRNVVINEIVVRDCCVVIIVRDNNSSIELELDEIYDRREKIEAILDE